MRSSSSTAKCDLAPAHRWFRRRRRRVRVFFSADLRKRSLMILAIWFLVSISYYGVFTWMPPRLAGEGFGFVRGYGFLVVLALAQIPGYALAAYGVEKWGRRPTLIGFCLLSALGCLLFVAAGTAMLIGVSLLIMSFALLGTWGALYACTPELYPTASRATGMGAAGAMARLGGLLAPSLMGARGGAEFRSRHRHLCRPSARGCRCGLSDRRRDAPGIARLRSPQRCEISCVSQDAFPHAHGGIMLRREPNKFRKNAIKCEPRVLARGRIGTQ
ncbi:MFS transporter (plasmid) [Sinorhizobium meliloti]|nr:MFS transporter [Sinorhizobium meliloti]